MRLDLSQRGALDRMYFRGGEVAALVAGGQRVWTAPPHHLIKSGQVGAFYHAHPAALAQDAAGTVPVTAPGQPVGLLRDQSGSGYHASQVSGPARPLLVRRPMTGLRNRVLPSSALSQWTFGGVSAADNIADGSTLTAVAGSGAHTLISARDTGPANTSLTITLEAKAGTESVLVLQPQGVSSSNRWTYQADLATGAVLSLGGLGEAASSGITSETLPDGWRKITIKMQPQTTAGAGVALRAFMRAEGAWSAVGTETLMIRKVQIENGTSATAYQTVTSTADVTEAGVPDTWRASLDGVDDRLLTPALAMASDEVTLVLAAALPATGTQYGVLRMADASGTIGVVKGADNQLRFHAGASIVPVVAPATPVSGAPEVWTMQAKITASQITIRRNGVLVATAVWMLTL